MSDASHLPGYYDAKHSGSDYTAPAEEKEEKDGKEAKHPKKFARRRRTTKKKQRNNKKQKRKVPDFTSNPSTSGEAWRSLPLTFNHKGDWGQPVPPMKKKKKTVYESAEKLLKKRKKKAKKNTEKAYSLF